MDIKYIKTNKSRLSEVDIENPSFGYTFSDHMFVADFLDGEWKNFEIRPYGDFSISPANAALHYGQSIFEGLKAYKTKDGSVRLFRPDANGERMVRSAERMCMEPFPLELFLKGLDALIKLDHEWIPTGENTSLYIRPFLFANDPYIGVRPSEAYRFMIITGPVGAYYSEPVKVKIEEHYTRAVAGGVGYAKTAGNYAASLFPALQAQKEGFHQLIWTDGKSHEYIEESGTMNIMFVINDTIITPPTSDSILPGVTRNSAITLAREWGVPVEERPVKVAEVISAIKDGSLTEAFGIGTAATVSQIKSIAFRDENFELPAVETREISNKLLDALDQIKLGAIEDKYGWIRKVDVPDHAVV